MSNALSDYVASTRYTRYSEALGRLETWEEAVERVRDMHLSYYADKLALPLWEGRSLGEWIGEAFEAVKRKELLPSMRSLQFGGPAILANNARIYNCSFSPADRTAFFKEFFWLLLCGTGVGFSVQKHHVEKLYSLPEYWEATAHFSIPDTIEGWALSIDEQIKNAQLGFDTEFDFSLIRPKGALLKTSGGRAPGPEPLKLALSKTRDVLIGARGRKLRPIEVYDICMHLAKAVLSGGIRRSATICLFSPDDVEMKNAKAEDKWWEKNPQRTASNNSAMLCRSTCSKAEFDSLFEAQKAYGEPGFYFANSLDHGTNPCQPAFAIVRKPSGLCTFEFLKEGDDIWSETGWTKVTKKWSTGVKPVYRVKNEMGGIFEGTLNHRVLSRGVKTFLATVLEEGRSLDWLPPGSTTSTPARVVAVEYLGMHEVFDITVDNEPHTYWTNGCNVSNCAEIGLYPYDEQGRSGVQFCNLTTIAARGINVPHDFFQRARFASLIGTLQAGYDKFPFLGEVSENITKREALLGVSICGILDNPDILLRPDVLRSGALVVREANRNVAELLGINPATRTTAIKPEGSSSIVLDSASGIHPRHAEKYLRRVRASKADPATAAFAAANPELVEDAYEDPTNTSVLTFACQAPAGAKLREDVSALELLEAAKIVQENWVKPGRSPDTVTDIHHNVSITVTVKPDEWESVREHLWSNRETYTGVALLQDFGDTAYPQAPLQTVRTADELAVWEKALLAKVPEDWRHEATHDTGEEHRGAAVACSGGACELKV